MYRWCVTSLSSGLWNIPTPVNQVQDSHVEQIHVKIDACASSDGRPNSIQEKKSGHTLHLLCHQGPLETVCLQPDSSCVPLARLPLTPGHHQARLLWCCERVNQRVEWCSVVFSHESRFCLYESVRHRPGERHLRSAFVHDTQAPPLVSWCGGHQLQLAVTSGVSAG